ncbi:MAG: hypothetical protein U0R24_09800 [Solirubrobacterales bacterium]
MNSTRLDKFLFLTVLAAAALCLVLAIPSQAKMSSQKIDRNVCLTTGGGKIVPIPGFPGERIDRRLLNDIKYLQKRFKIFITDGYSGDPVHAANGEHPMGLALDIVPNTAAGGTWNDIDALARMAEPSQDHPVAPFRWVGYDGDAGHGRGNHLHLSWNHSDTKPGTIADSVYTLRCPGSGGSPGKSSGNGNGGGSGGQGDKGGKNDGGGQGDKGGKGNGGRGGDSGGIEPGKGSGPSGGVGVGRITAELDLQAAHPVVETGGEGFGR